MLAAGKDEAGNQLACIAGIWRHHKCYVECRNLGGLQFVTGSVELLIIDRLWWQEQTPWMVAVLSLHRHKCNIEGEDAECLC